VLEALIRKQSPFNRTPKYNVSDGEDKSMPARMKNVLGNVYTTRNIDGVSIIELLLAIYMSYAVYFTYSNDLYVSLPLILLFQLGFFYTSLLSIVHTPITVFFNRKNK
ncbi:MAG TPA: hypothetical protein PKG60_15715, partial [Spirochaetota bacterium]|nr:hypothetical protein [Spirochaetota bacterium]